ncbi:tripartite motif containing 13-like, partial [Hibiscus syriacus]|uniref:tripartite motif containing 13-like n=1 Tax=Hibiscus syriacus TaxID=106335 RepID=UPI00192212CE
CSNNESPSVVSSDEGLDCPICCESFNVVENVPYVLWCGHTLCINCILGLQWAAVNFPTLPVQLPLFISCPWCNLLSFRLIYKGNLMFPRKNYFLLWMVESRSCNRLNSRYPLCEDRQPDRSSSNNLASGNQLTRSNHRREYNLDRHSESSGSSSNHVHVTYDFNSEQIHSFLWKSMVFFIHLSAKFPLVIIFLLITMYAIPASVVILALYMLLTVLVALPSFLILYFAYPSLDWLVNEIIK